MTIGLLNAYHFDSTPGNYQEQYGPLFLEWLDKALPKTEFKNFKVAFNHFPKDIHECEGWILTGSPAGVYEDKDWIQRLMSFTQEGHKAKKKILGICFGHQLLAQALGGQAQISQKGWGVGVRSFDILYHKKWMRPESKGSVSLLFSHQDQVTALPPESTHLASDEFCKFQMFSIGDHIFSIQGHPEFSKNYAELRYKSNAEAMGESVFQEALDSLKSPTDEKLMAEWIYNFFNL